MEKWKNKDEQHLFSLSELARNASLHYSIKSLHSQSTAAARGYWTPLFDQEPSIVVLKRTREAKIRRGYGRFLHSFFSSPRSPPVLSIEWRSELTRMSSTIDCEEEHYTID